MTKRLITQKIVKDVANKTRKVLSDFSGDEVTSLIEVEDLPTAIRSIPYGWYGVKKDRSVTNTALTRIGSPDLHRKLPVQSNMRRCVLSDDGTVAYYLHPSDSHYKENGELAVLDGTDGQVMVEIPDFYVKYESYTDTTTGHVINEWKISEYNLPGFTKVDKCYYSAYEAALDRTNSKLASVVNTTARYRGGNNTSSWDSTYRSLLGMPVTNKSLTEFRTYASNRGSRWTCHDNNLYTIVCTLYLVEYANTNCQLAFNSTLTADGYRQGGLGDGVTTISSSSVWKSYNSRNPFVPCGTTNSLGNNTGVVNYTAKNSSGSTWATVSVPSYRGIENLFGHIWKHTDAILVNIQSSAAGGKSMVYECYDISKYSSSITADYTYIGDEARESSVYTKNIIFPCMVASETGATSSTGWADYHYTEIPSSGSAGRCVLFGGTSIRGAYAGFASSYSNSEPSKAFTDVGSRLCFLSPNTL